MVKQGDIIKICMDPQLGSEQSGCRPAMVISNDRLNHFSKVVLVCPITKTKRDYPSHVRFGDNAPVTGEVMCEQIKAMDLSVRPYQYIGSADENMLEEVVETIRYITERQ